MAKNEERNLNVTIKSEQEDKDEVIISMSGIMKKLKKFLLPWIIVAVILGVMVLGVNAVSTMSVKPPLNALVSFTYDGIEKGLDPAGRTFDANSLKNPSVITDALISLNLDSADVENVRSNIIITPIVPTDAIDRMTTYKSIIEQSSGGNLAAGQALLDTSYYSTQFKITFNYAAAGYDTNKGVQVINAVLEKYRDYFYSQYGYNHSLGAAVSTINYKDYDYTEAVDLFRSTLQTLEEYLKDLSDEDVTRFRSTAGYTFEDLYQSVLTIKSLDLDKITSYVTSNNVTNDKDAAVSYYTYMIDELNRQKNQLNESLEAVKAAISAYQKDTLLVMQNADGANTEISKSSEEYDRLVQQNVNLASQLATTKQQINFYTERKDTLTKGTAGTEDQKKYVDNMLDSLNTKVKNLVDLTRTTADEYYQNVEFANAYSILVPASSSGATTIKSVIKASMMPAIIAEAVLFVIYIAVAFISAIVDENRKNAAKAASASTSGSDGDGGDGDDDDIVDIIEEAVSDKTDKPAKDKNIKK